MKTKPEKPSSPALASKKAKARTAAKDSKTAATKPKSKAAAAPPRKARRLEEIAESKKGLFAIDPTLLSVEEGFNQREDYGNMNQLAEDLFHNGLETPLKVRKLPGTETILIVRGHRRHKAITQILIPQGRWHLPGGGIKPVDCQPEEQGTTEFQRLASQLSSNTGLAYNLLEKAAIYRRLLALDTSLKPADISRRFGETKQAVSDALRLVNHGCHLLIENVRHGTVAASTAVTIIKQVGNETDAQEACFQSALATAHAAGRSHVMPKDLPASTVEPSPGREPMDYWTYGEEPTDYGWNDSKVATTPDTLTAAAHSSLTELRIHTAHRNGKWFSSLDYSCSGGSMLGGGGLPSYKRTPFPTALDAIRHEWDGFCEHDLPQLTHRHPKSESIIRHCIKLGHDLSGRFPTGTAWDEAILTKLLPKDDSPPPFIDDLKDEDEDEQDEQTDDETQAGPVEGMRFLLHVMDDTPEDPIAEDSSFYHETDRLVLDHAELLPEGIGLLHLLSAATSFGVAYGFRIGSYERLPDVAHIETLDTDPEEGLKVMLEAAIDHIVNERPNILHVRDELHALLADAITRYYINGEQPGHLPFVATGQTDQSGSNNPGFQKTLHSPGGNGGGGGGGTGYAPPDKQMEKIDKLLDDLADKKQGIEDRVTTADIIMGILRSERPVSDLKNYLLGN